MPGAIPGLPGFAAFAGLKFGGYVVAGVVLNKLQPAIQTTALKIAAARTAFGIVLGPLFSLGFLGLLFVLFPDPYKGPPDYVIYSYYPLLVILRLLVWALIIYFVSRETDLSRSNLWKYALCGALCSCLLDLPACARAWVAPGKMVIC